MRKLIEITTLQIFDMKIDDDMHCSVPITRVVLKKLIREKLICATTYEHLLENIQLSHLEYHGNFDSEDKGGSEASAEELSILALA